MVPDEDAVTTGADALFQQHSIAEIVEIRQKILQDITKKNHDVRELVGERYRDLIDAADTIQNMKVLVDDLPAKLQELPISCEKFKPCPLEVATKDPQVFTNFSQTKLILDICGKLGALIEAREMISSAALISLAQVAIRDHHLPQEMLRCSQKSLKNSTRLLNKTCLIAIADPDCDKEALAESLCTLSVLEGYKPEKLVEVFFEERTQHLNRVLESQFSVSKEKFSSLAQYLIKTINLAQSMALDRPYFVEYFDNHRASTQGIVALVKDPLSLSTHFLPQSLSEFRCILPEVLHKANLISFTTSKANLFIEELRVSCRQKLALELQCYSECKGIAKTYDHLMKSINELKLQTDFLNKKINIYEAFFQEAIVNRVAGIYEEILNTATEQLLNSVHLSFSEASRVKSSNVSNLCKNFDSAVKSALEALEDFGPYNEIASDEHRSLVDLASASTGQKLTQVTAFVAQCVESGVRCCYFLSLLSHVAADMTTCVHLQKIFGSKWHQQRQSLIESRDLAASTAMAVITEEVLEPFKMSFSESAVKHVLLNMASVKARVEVSDEGEGGVLSTTTIHLPQHCLQPLSQMLFKVCVEIRESMECGVSNRVVERSNQRLQSAVEEIYQSVIDRRAGLSQSVQQELALQLLFDIEYMEKLLSTAAGESIRTQLIALIDPVDYHMLRSHLDEGVAGLVAQTAMLYGLICPKGALGGKPRKQTTQEHNIMALAEQTLPRFSLLPVGVPSLRR